MELAANLVHRSLIRYHVFVTVCMLIFPITLITLHWNLIMETEKASQRQRHDVENVHTTVNGTTVLVRPFLPYEHRKKMKRRRSDMDQGHREYQRHSKPDRQQNQHALPLASNFPLIPSAVFQPKSSQPLPVLYIGVEGETSASLRNDEDTDSYSDPMLEALEQSSFVSVYAAVFYSATGRMIQRDIKQKIHPSKVSAVVIDWAGLHRDCHVLHRILGHISKQFAWLRNTPPYILMLDGTASSRIEVCANDNGDSNSVIPLDQMRLAKRSVVEGRRWNNTKGWVESGRLIPTSTVLRSSGFVADDFIGQLHEAYRRLEKGGTERSIDVSHYWRSLSSPTQTVPHDLFYNRLRQAVSAQLSSTREMMTTAHDSNEPNRRSSQWVERVGVPSRPELTVESDGHSEQEKANEEGEIDISMHFTILATSRIVVVAQADEWEDHDNRLMEAMASGGMVLCDTMLAPPPGLKHKTNIIFYDNLRQLDEYIRFFLDPANEERRDQIAKRGVELALGQHRSWHVVESLLFGKALTVADRQLPSSNWR
jgi:Glycosyl transferases group 1